MEPLVARTALRHALGDPLRTIEFRKEAAGGPAPTALDVLVYEPPDEDPLPLTLLVSAGMSSQRVGGRVSRVEFAIGLRAPHADPDIDLLIHGFAELCVMPFLEPLDYCPPLVLHDVAVPLFDDMDSLLLAHVSPGAPFWIHGLEPRALLVKLVPLYRNEANLATERGDAFLMDLFTDQEIDPCRPRRPELNLADLPTRPASDRPLDTPAPRPRIRLGDSHDIDGIH